MLLLPLLLTTALVYSLESLPPLLIHENKFYDSLSGEQFYIKGVAYQRVHDEEAPGTHYIDSISSTSSCLRDALVLEELGINVVRVYSIDPEASHKECMKAFSAAGIYVVADLSEPRHSINRKHPYWSTDLFDRYKSVVDAMAHYDNVLGFFVGNEVTTSKDDTDSSAFVRAAVRDVRKYIKERNYRAIPLGYASTDDADIRLDTANYFMCGDDESSVDFFAINMYEWCGYSSYVTSGYRERTIEFASSPVPVFFSEYGCNTISPRPFTEVEALYSPSMSQVWSGGLAYEYFENGNGYGLVGGGSKGPLSFTEDYKNLKARMKSVQPRKSTIEVPFKQTPKTDQLSCKFSKNWKASTTLPPTPHNGKCECLSATHNCIKNPDHKGDDQKLLEELCLLTDCEDILANGTTGVYGKYSDCELSQRVSFAFDQIYKETGECDFDARALLVSTNPDLSSIFSQDGSSCSEELGKNIKLANTTQNVTAPEKLTNGRTSHHTREGFNSTSKSSGSLVSAFNLAWLTCLVAFV